MFVTIWAIILEPWKTNEGIPSPAATFNKGILGMKSCLVNLTLLNFGKYKTRIKADKNWLITVAQADPAIPQPNPKIKIGLRIVLSTAPKIMANIEYLGLLSERTIGLVLIEISKKGIPKDVILAKVIAYSKISSVDPNAYIRGFKNIWTKIVIIIPIINNEDTAVPTTDFAFSGFPRPNSRLKLEAAPIPIIKPIARQIVVRGKATFVAALPK